MVLFSFKKKKKLQDELSGLHGDCGIVGKNQMLSTSFNQVCSVLLDL
jgi:hypothetical protein